MNTRRSFGRERSSNAEAGGSRSNNWVSILRIGMGLQLLFLSFSLRNDWVALFENDGSQTISRDLSEALLSAQSHFIPRLGWLVQGGAAIGLDESTILSTAFFLLFSSGLSLAIGLFSRSAA